MSRKGTVNRKELPQAWEWSISDYLHAMAAQGHRPATLKLRRDLLTVLARGVDCAPDEVTADRLIDWFGKQKHWSREYRRSNRSAARGFFSWAYKAGRVPVYLGDILPRLPQVKGAPRPAPDDVWEAALAGADARTALMLRLACEAGLRRAEVAQVSTRDVFIAGGRAQLEVKGKGGKTRIVPISSDLAESIRRRAAGWLFPDYCGGHLSPEWVGTVVSRALPDGYSMHTLRHRYASKAFRGSRNLLAVKTLLGHESVATTQRYTDVDNDEVRAAAACAW